MKTPDRTVSDSMEPLVYQMTLVSVGNEHGLLLPVELCRGFF
jgi:hypothetical protein